MLSRLSGLASTVLHELSGDGEDAGTAPSPAGPEFESSQQNMEEESPEDVLERLAHMEKLVAQLKTLLREKDAQLHQKDAMLEEERQAAEAKLLKLKLQAKVKVAHLNKRIEELAAQGGAAPAEGQPEEPPPPVQGDHSLSEGPVDETGALRRQLQEQEETVRELRGQLQEATGRLGDAQAQISCLQGDVLEKESLREEQALQLQAEIHQAEARQAEMQQNLRQLQRKVEEQEEALLGRTQVVELLQQELNVIQGEKQNLLEKLQKAEAALETSRTTLASAQEESRNLVKSLELELAEQKAAFQQSQEEVEEMRQELARAKAAQTEWDQERQAEVARHALEVAEKNQEMVELQKAEQDLHASYEAVQAENARLWQKVDAPAESLPDDASATPGETPKRCPELGLSQPELETATGVPSPPLSQVIASISTFAEEVARPGFLGRDRREGTERDQLLCTWGRGHHFLPHAGPLLTDAAPGAPQEKDETNARELQELQTQLSEAKQQQSLARQGLSQLQQLLQEERERRLAAEEASSAAQEQIRRWESEEYAQSLETSIAMPPSHEHARLLGSAESAFSKARGPRGLPRVLRSLFCPRRLFSLLATLYLLGIHLLIFLHAVGRL
ncbi:golgin subfamily B member 1-like [Notechis scutatus]|uniref:Golgin subfamily B member 1-like n=1 Tax=Notechis scutatus TaxID=8663 RepID=A0A6J1W242_9SAUR|nr:golgin subfamily B member 1-like [Notechis scutatus]